MLSPYLLHLITLIAIYSILAMALNFVMGYGGVLNFGHVAVFGIGAYTSAIVTKTYDWSFGVGVLAAMGTGGLAALFLSILLRRVRGDFMALLTLWFALAVYTVALNVPEITNGALGIAAIARPAFARASGAYAALVVGALAVVSLFLWRIVASPFGLVMGAMRDDELGSRIIGKNTIHVKRTALIVSGVIAGGAGALYAHYIGFIDPSSFYLFDLVLVVTAVVLGGLGSLAGSVLGIIIYFLIPEALRYLNLPAETLGALRQIIFTTLLLLIVILRPKGIMGKISLE